MFQPSKVFLHIAINKLVTCTKYMCVYIRACVSSYMCMCTVSLYMCMCNCTCVYTSVVHTKGIVHYIVHTYQQHNPKGCIGQQPEGSCNNNNGGQLALMPIYEREGGREAARETCSLS